VKQVAILGAGLVVKPLADYLLDRAGYRVLMATRTVARAEVIIAGHSNGRALAWTTEDLEGLEGIVRESDLVVSMIPPTLHIPVAEACLRNGKPLVTTSYINPQMQALDEQAKKNGVLLLNEIGEDPGMDHMGAKQMIDEAVRNGGRVRSLTSYGAGLPSFESNRNPMGYKFSWSPRGVMMAAQTAAAYLKNGEVVEVPAAELFDHHWLVDIEGLGSFETYPNRSSLRYLSHFGLDGKASLYRGLLRFVGWCSTMKSLIALNLLDGTKDRDFAGLSYREFTASSMGKPRGDREDVAAFLGLSLKSDTMERLGWLGLFDESPLALARGANMDVIVDLMVKKMSYSPGEKDMIIVHDEIEVEFPGRQERHLSTMMVEGVPHGDSAMSRAVSLPAAIASRLILEGKIDLSGVQMPMLTEIYEPVLTELEEHTFTFRHQLFELCPG
jgi:saccharopine dehydrogenase-like NADP-dependent oxidoreductase